MHAVEEVCSANKHKILIVLLKYGDIPFCPQKWLTEKLSTLALVIIVQNFYIMIFFFCNLEKKNIIHIMHQSNIFGPKKFARVSPLLKYL